MESDTFSRLDTLKARGEGLKPFFLLDFDGTLAPIAATPALAQLPDPTRLLLAKLATQTHVAIVSGRQLSDLKRKVGIPNITYVGSHGLEIQLPTTSPIEPLDLTSEKQEVNAFYAELMSALSQLPGVLVEYKIFGITVHYRLVPQQLVSRITHEVQLRIPKYPLLRTCSAKMALEIRPRIAWDKGKAVSWCIENFAPQRGAVPIYIGDDETDKDAFRELRGVGVSIFVGSSPEGGADHNLKDPAAVHDFLNKCHTRFFAVQGE